MWKMFTKTRSFECTMFIFLFLCVFSKKTVLNICEYWFTYKLALKLPFFEDEKEKCLKTNFPNLQGANDR